MGVNLFQAETECLSLNSTLQLAQAAAAAASAILIPCRNLFCSERKQVLLRAEPVSGGACFGGSLSF